MKAVDLTIQPVQPTSGVPYLTTATKQVPPLAVAPRKNGYINGLQRYTDHQTKGDANVTDEEDFDIDESDCGVKTVVKNTSKSVVEPDRKEVNGCNGISNGKLSIIDLNKVDDPTSVNQQPDVILTSKRSEVKNSGFYLLSGRFIKDGEEVRSGATHSVDLLNGEACANEGARNGENGARNGENGARNGENGDRAESPSTHCDRTEADMTEHAFGRLQEELKKAHLELKLRDEEVLKLRRIREDGEAELEELTASLFQEAHKMVREANVKQASAERAYKESEMKIDVMSAEVSALKALVLTSTPSAPNPHLHPQIDLRGNRAKDDSSIGGVGLFNRKHRRSPSHFNLKYGRENSPPESPVKEPLRSLQPETLETKEGCEVDPEVHKEFATWKDNPKVDKSEPFIARVYREEIDLCLDFPNKELSCLVRNAVETGNVFIEAVSDKSKTVFPKKCALLDVPRQCHYRMKFGDQSLSQSLDPISSLQWYCISQICRNRIIAVCDFLNYLKYIERGLVKSSVHDVFWEMTRLRKEMVLARLGLALAS